jgi:uncharacterized repeat protein (TIGR01451 family)
MYAAHGIFILRRPREAFDHRSMPGYKVANNCHQDYLRRSVMSVQRRIESKAIWLGVAVLMGFGGISIAQNGALNIAQNTAPTAAQQQSVVVPELKAYKVVKNDNKETLAPADSIRPGETIEYQVRYLNRGGVAVKDLNATLPIPGNLQFVPGSAQPANAEASLDGKSFSALPLKRTVKDEQGNTKTVLVPAGEYRYLRWKVSSIAAGKSAEVAARAKLASLDSNPTSNTSASGASAN